MDCKATSFLPVIIIDSREKSPYKFNKCKTCDGAEVAKLDYGDYQLKGLPDLIAIERKKNVVELCGNLGKQRERFERELQRMQAAKFRFIVVEDYWSSIFRLKYSRVHPNALFESIMALELKYGVHFIFAGNRAMAHKITRSLLLKAYKYRNEGKI